MRFDSYWIFWVSFYFLIAFYFNTPSTLRFCKVCSLWSRLKKSIKWIATDFCKNPILSDHPPIYPLVPPWGWHLWFKVKYLNSCHKLSQNVVHIPSAEKIISADIHLLTSRVWKRARKSLQTPHTLEITCFNADPLTAADRKCVLHPPHMRATFFQPHRPYKYWPNTFLQTTGCNFMFLKVKFIVLSFDNTVFRKTSCFGSRYLVLSAQTHLENIMASCWKYPVVSPIQIVKHHPEQWSLAW